MSSKPTDIVDVHAILGQNIRKLRKLQKLTLEELGQKIGKSKSILSKYENGAVMDVATLTKIAAVLNVELYRLTEGIVTYTPPQKQSASAREHLYYFDTDKLYLYYYNGFTKRMSFSVIRKLQNHAESGDIPVRCYFNLKQHDEIMSCEYHYDGFFRQVGNHVYLVLDNLEMGDLSLTVFSIPQRKTDIVNGLMMGLSDTPKAPVCIKILLTRKTVKDMNDLKPLCMIDRNDRVNIRTFNRLYVQYQNYDEFI